MVADGSGSTGSSQGTVGTSFPALAATGPPRYAERIPLRGARRFPARQRGIHDIRRGVENELSIDTDVHVSIFPLKIPGIQAAAGLHAHVDAVVVDQIARTPGLRMCRKVGRGRDDRHAHWRPNRHGDHVLVYGVAQAYAGIEPVGHDVPKAIVDVELHLDVWIFQQQRGEPG